MLILWNLMISLGLGAIALFLFRRQLAAEAPALCAVRSNGKVISRRDGGR